MITLQCYSSETENLVLLVTFSLSHFITSLHVSDYFTSLYVVFQSSAHLLTLHNQRDLGASSIGYGAWSGDSSGLGPAPLALARCRRERHLSGGEGSHVARKVSLNSAFNE